MMSGMRNNVIFFTLLFTSLNFNIARTINNNYSKNCPSNEDDYYLPSDIEPRHYEVNLIKLQDNIFDGESKTFIDVIHETTNIIFHGYNLYIDEETILLRNIYFTTPNYSSPNGNLKEVSYCAKSQIYILKFHKKLFPGFYTLIMKFKAYPDGNYGWIPILSSKYDSKPTGARGVFPCWDEPIFKATFTLTFVHSSTAMSFSSMPLKDLNVLSDEKVMTTFYPTPEMAVYLMTIMLVEFTVEAINCDNITVWYKWDQMSYKWDQMYIARIANLTDNFLSDYTGHLWEKMATNIIAYPNFPNNAVGSWRIAIFNEEHLSYEPDFHFPGRKLEVWKLLANQMVQQCIDSLIIPLKSSYIWFSQALANFLSYKIIGKEYGEDVMRQLFVVQVQQPIMHDDIALNISSIITDDDPFYSHLIYKKASVLIKMLEYIITEEKLQEAIEQYLNAYEFATPFGFLKIVNKIYEENYTGLTIGEIMKIWLSLRRYPTLLPQLDNGGMKIIVLSYDAKYISYEQKKWPIPLIFTTQSSCNFSRDLPILWNQNRSQNDTSLHIAKPDPEDWFILNVQQFGYYRVNYEFDNWIKLADFLNNGEHTKIHVLNRAQIIDDAYHLEMQNEVKYGVFYRLIGYLKKERNFIVWHSMMNILHYMSPFFNYPESKYFKILMLDIMRNVLSTLGYNKDSKDDDMLKATQLLLLNWACKHGHDECRERAHDKLLAHLHNPEENKISPGWEDWTYCAGIMNVNITDWNKSLMPNISRDKIMLNQIVCVEDEHLVQELITQVALKSHSKWINVKDAVLTKLYLDLVKRHARKPRVLDFILTNFAAIIKGHMTHMEGIAHLIMSVYSKCQLNKISSYLEEEHMNGLKDNQNTSDEVKETEQVKWLIDFRLRQINQQKIIFMQRFNNGTVIDDLINISGTKIDVMFFTLLFIVSLTPFNAAMTSDGSKYLEGCPPNALDYRLPLDVKPRTYKINLSLSNTIIVGTSSTIIAVNSRTPYITIHAYNLIINISTIVLYKNEEDDNGQYSVKVDEVEKLIYCKETQAFLLKFYNEISPGIYTLDMAFEGILSNTHGFVAFQSLKYDKQPSYITLLRPTGARSVFPCWDDLTFKANFNITFRRSYFNKIFSSMPSAYEVVSADGETNIVFQTTPAISTYLVMIVLVNFNLETRDNKDVVMWYKWNEKSQILVTERVIKLANSFLTGYTNNLWGKWKITVVAYPNLPVDAEGSLGFMIFRDKRVFYEADSHFPGHKLDIWKLIGKQMTQQCIESYVSPTEWSHQWFSHAFATYLSYKIAGQDYSEDLMMQLFVVQVQQPAMHNDIAFNVTPVIHEYDPIYSIFIYKKASALIKMFEHIIPEGPLQQAFAEYLSAYAYSSAIPSDFFKILESHLHKFNYIYLRNIAEVMHIWLSRRGFPILFVQEFDSDTVISYEVKSEEQGWPIPVTFTTQDSLDFITGDLPILWINNNSSRNDDSTLNIYLRNIENWFIFNVQQFGYYRVNYIYSNWKKIVDYLNTENYTQIHVLNRAQLIDDAFHFIMKNMLQYDIFQRLTDYLVRETHFIPWHTMMNVLQYMSPFFNYLESKTFKDHMLFIMGEVLNTIGYDEHSTDDEMSTATRLLLLNWACKHGHAECREKARKKLIAYIEYPKDNKILPGWEDWTNCAGIMNADNTIWYEVMLNIMHGYDKVMLNYAVCVEDEHLVQELLALATFRPDDKWTKLGDAELRKFFHDLVRKHARKPQVLDFILKNFNEISYGRMTYVEGMAEIIMSVYSKCQLRKIWKYMEEENNQNAETKERVKSLLNLRLRQINEEINKFVHPFYILSGDAFTDNC
ncbi:uncharacterized protein LOC105188829 [Harpegnathos saltator]|uniref:uncharacterized protein LOC105188829 n=1 Tax=Harpegnathos saltator TaxID=610380 RepID=UPI000DBEEB6D|nr:uncharacterized protein LOC105188829 [Harpegnathos saltator]